MAAFIVLAGPYSPRVDAGVGREVLLGVRCASLADVLASSCEVVWGAVLVCHGAGEIRATGAKSSSRGAATLILLRSKSSVNELIPAPFLLFSQ